MDATNGTPNAIRRLRRNIHAVPGTPEKNVHYSARKKVLVKNGTPKNTAVNTVRRNIATGLKREQNGLQFITPVEQNGVKRDGLGIHVASVCVAKM